MRGKLTNGFDHFRYLKKISFHFVASLFFKPPSQVSFCSGVVQMQMLGLLLDSFHTIFGETGDKPVACRGLVMPGATA